LVTRRIGRGTFVVLRNGHASVVSEAKTFACLLPPNASLAGHRASLLSYLRSALSKQGHLLTEINLEDRDQDQSALSVWPAVVRRRIDGLIAIPDDVLSGGTGRLNAATTAEIIRRHLPAVLIGVLSQSAKLDAVAPDFTDAGFRLAEHLVLSGCTRVVTLSSAGAGREAELVHGGAAAACERHRAVCDKVVLTGADKIACAKGFLHDPSAHPASGGLSADRRGILCVGNVSLHAAQRLLAGPSSTGLQSHDLAAVLEPGDDSTACAGVCYYDVPVERLAEWAVRLLVDARPGRLPVEVMIPGVLRASGTGAVQSAPSRHAPEDHTTSGQVQGLVEARV
jgi:hypothetical protein